MSGHEIRTGSGNHVRKDNQEVGAKQETGWK